MLEELNFEKLIFGEEEKRPVKLLRVHWIVLAAVMVIAVALIAFWPKDRGEPYGEAAPDMVSWRSMDKDVAGAIYRRDFLIFTPELDAGEWGVEKIVFGVQAQSGFFVTNTSSATPNNVTVNSGKSATWIPAEEKTSDYVTFTAWAGEHIVGYAVVKIQPIGEVASSMPSLYEVEILDSVLFPLKDGEFQNVTEEYVRQRMEELKKQ